MPFRSRAVLALGLVALALTASAPRRADAQLPTANLRTIWPVGGTAGQTVLLAALEGDGLDEVSELRFSDPRIVATLQSDPPLPGDDAPQPRWGQFQIAVAAEVAEGSYDVRAVGRYGISNPRRFYVTHLPCVTVEAARFSPETAFAVEVNQVIQARATAEQVDHYQIQATEGQHYEIQCRAASLDSRIDANLVICSADGRELDRVPATHQTDLRTLWQAPATGLYSLRVHDRLFRGGSEHFYQLQVSPLEPTAQVRWSAAATTTLVASMAPEGEATYANDFADAAAPQFFDFEAKGGEPRIIEVVSAGAGAATDPQIIIARVHPNEAGPPRIERLQEADDHEWVAGGVLGITSKDPSVRFVPPADGTYRVILRDLQQTTRPEWDKRYSLSIRTPQPDFQLVAALPHPSLDPNQTAPHGCLLRRGETMAVEVAVIAKDGFFDPITGRVAIAGGELTVPYEVPWQWPLDVRVDGLPAGVTFQGVRFEGAARRAFVMLKASDDCAPWTGPIQIVGHIEITPQVLDRPAEPRTIQWPDPSSRGLISVRPCASLQLSVTDLETTPLRLTLGSEGAAVVGKRGTTVEIPVHLARGEAAKGKVTVRAAGLPADVRAEELAFEGETVDGILKVQIGANAPLGTVMVFVNSETELPWPRNPQALARAEAYLAKVQAKLGEIPADAADEGSVAQRTTLTQAVATAQERVNQLRESTKPQNTRAFEPSNSIPLQIDPQ